MGCAILSSFERLTGPLEDSGPCSPGPPLFLDVGEHHRDLVQIHHGNIPTQSVG